VDRGAYPFRRISRCVSLVSEKNGPPIAPVNAPRTPGDKRRNGGIGIPPNGLPIRASSERIHTKAIMDALDAVTRKDQKTIRVPVSSPLARLCTSTPVSTSTIGR